MSDGLTGQGPMTGVGAEAASREVSLGAVRDDVMTMGECLHNLDTTVNKLRGHLMGEEPLEKGVISENRQNKEPPSGLLFQLCQGGAFNIQKVSQIQEKINQICYELGEGR